MPEAQPERRFHPEREREPMGEHFEATGFQQPKCLTSRVELDVPHAFCLIGVQVRDLGQEIVSSKGM